MLLVIEEGITVRICHTIYRYAKADNKYLNKQDINKESFYLSYEAINNLHGWEM